MSTPNDRLRAHMQVFAQKVKEYSGQGLDDEKTQLKAAQEANRIAPLKETDFNLLRLLGEMTDRQRIAYEYPCRMPMSLMGRRYHKDIYIGESVVSTLVTLSTIESNPAEWSWDASVALLDATMQPQKMKRISPRQRKAISQILHKLLAGVGVEPGEVIESATSLHLQKALTSTELEGLRED